MQGLTSLTARDNGTINCNYVIIINQAQSTMQTDCIVLLKLGKSDSKFLFKDIELETILKPI